MYSRRRTANIFGANSFFRKGLLALREGLRGWPRACVPHMIIDRRHYQREHMYMKRGAARLASERPTDRPTDRSAPFM